MKTLLEKELEEVKSQHKLRVSKLEQKIKKEAKNKYSDEVRTLAEQLHSSLCFLNHSSGECSWHNVSWESDIKRHYAERAKKLLDLNYDVNAIIKVIRIATNYR